MADLTRRAFVGTVVVGVVAGCLPTPPAAQPLAPSNLSVAGSVVARPRQYLVPGGAYLNLGAVARTYLVPGGAYVTETGVS